jgi:hypothetical protein
MKTIDYVVSLGSGSPPRPSATLRRSGTEGTGFGLRTRIPVGDCLGLACGRRFAGDGFGIEWLDSDYRLWYCRKVGTTPPWMIDNAFLYGEIFGNGIALLYADHIQYGWSLSGSIERLYERLMEAQVTDIRRDVFSYTKCFSMSETAKRQFKVARRRCKESLYGR